VDPSDIDMSFLTSSLELHADANTINAMASTGRRLVNMFCPLVVLHRGSRKLDHAKRLVTGWRESDLSDGEFG
ncbi:MAG: hypothetical protein VW271_08820, partial [Chloroflexota bacterium]